MDPITVAIVAALAAGAAAGMTKLGESVIVDGYQALKALIKRKFGGESEVAKALDGLEAKPDSAGRKETLKEEIAAVNADRDAELLKAAQDLLQQIEAQPGGRQIIVTASGERSVAAGGGIVGSTVITGDQPKSS